MKQLIKLFIVSFFLFEVGILQSSVIDGARVRPKAEELLKSVVNQPKLSYRGRIVVSRRVGKKSLSEQADVFYSHPNQFRWNYLKPDGSVDRVVIGDGKNQLVYLADEKAFIGKAPKSVSKILKNNQEWDLLYSNYQVSILREDFFLERPTWLLELNPLFSGKPKQHLMVDQQTYVVLENRRFRGKGGKIAAVTRFTQFEPLTNLSADLFRLENEDKAMTAVFHGLDPDFSEYSDSASPSEIDVPETLPHGFVFESGDRIDVQGETVDHFRYTDGLAVISIFVSDLPVEMNSHPQASIISVPESPNPIFLSTSGRILFKKGNHRYYTLVGDLSKKILKSASAHLK